MVDHRKTVALDVDGVLADYSKGWQGVDKIGDPIPGAIEFTKELGKFADITIFTTRCKAFAKDQNGPDGVPEEGRQDSAVLVEHVHQWLYHWGFHYNEIYSGQGKPMAAAYIDDRAIECVPQKYGAMSYKLALEKTKRLLDPESSNGRTLVHIWPDVFDKTTRDSVISQRLEYNCPPGEYGRQLLLYKHKDHVGSDSTIQLMNYLLLRKEDLPDLKKAVQETFGKGVWQ